MLCDDGVDEFAGFDPDAFVHDHQQQQQQRHPPTNNHTPHVTTAPQHSPFTLPSALPMSSPPKPSSFHPAPISSSNSLSASASSSVASTLASANPWARTTNNQTASGLVNSTAKQQNPTNVFPSQQRHPQPMSTSTTPRSSASSSSSFQQQQPHAAAASYPSPATPNRALHVPTQTTTKPSTANWIAANTPSSSNPPSGSGSIPTASSNFHNSALHPSTPIRSSHANTAAFSHPTNDSTSPFMPPTHAFAAPPSSSSSSTNSALTFASPAPTRPSLATAAAAAVTHNFAQSMQKAAPTVFNAAVSSSSFQAKNSYAASRPAAASSAAAAATSSSPSPFSVTSAPPVSDLTTRVRVVSSNVPTFHQNRSLPGQGTHHARTTTPMAPASPQRTPGPQRMSDDNIQSACSAYMSMDPTRRSNELDPDAIGSYIFPREKSARRYQRDIVWTCLRYNTLVCLPTGTGKTLIAAVALFNFYRWYPQSQVLFVAPTRPLVVQQLRACQQIMGIPDHHCALMIGQSHSEQQKRDIYSSDETRVLFATPQAIMTDMDKGYCRINRFVFLCIDECHKAQKGYSYTELADCIHQSGHDCRIVGLSATPGTDTYQVAELVKRVRFARLEIRDESDVDLAAHLHVRDVQMYVVKASDVIPKIEEAIFDCVRPRLIYLAKAQIMFSYDNPKQLSAQKVNTIRGSFMKQNDSKSKERYWEIFNQFTLLYNLYRIRDRLREAGVGQCYEAMREFIIGDATGHIKKKTGEAKSADPVTAAFRNDAVFKKLRTMVESNMQSVHSVLDEDTPLMRGNGSGRASPSNAAAALSGKEHDQKLEALRTHNPKIAALVQLVSTHFKQHEQREEWMRSDQPDDEEDEEQDSMYEESKRGDAKIYFNGKASESNVIIFADRRGVVQELVSRLNQFGSTIRAAPFIGQAKDGMNQKEQAACLEKFSDGTYNVIVATCIAEEGLDMGHVDLIISFDITGSPLRIIQRFGRTGRKRRGRCITMVEEGREVEEYNKAMGAKDRLLHQLKSYGRNPPFAINKEMKMMPPQILPVEVLMDVAHRRDQPASKKRNRNSLSGAASNSDSSWQLPPVEFARMQNLWRKHPPQALPVVNDPMPSAVHRIMHSKHTLKQCDLALLCQMEQRKFDRAAVEEEANIDATDGAAISKRPKIDDNSSMIDVDNPSISLFNDRLWEEQHKQVIDGIARAAEQVRLSKQHQLAKERERISTSRMPLSKELSAYSSLSRDSKSATVNSNNNILHMFSSQQQQQSEQKLFRQRMHMSSSQPTVRAVQYADVGK